MADHTQRFSDRVAFYVRARPGYPAGLLQFLRDRIVLSPGHVIADVGSGTGLLAELFVRNGNRVFGIEPNGPMREAGAQLLRCQTNFTATDGTAEATGLDDGSVDLVTAGQAFHWFDPEKARAEFGRILRGPKWVALVWNERKRQGADFTAAYQQLVERHQIDRSAVASMDSLDNTDGAIDRFFAPYGFELAIFDNRQTIDRAGLLDRLASSSYMPLPPDPRHTVVMSEASAMFERHQKNEVVTIEHQTRVYLGRCR